MPFSTLTFFFFNDTATTEIYTLSLHDALPISSTCGRIPTRRCRGSRSAIRKTRRSSSSAPRRCTSGCSAGGRDRKSTRLNSSHTVISYAVFCLKKKKQKLNHTKDKHNTQRV